MPSLDTLLAAALRGAVAGLGTGLFALALVVIYRVTGVLNLALGGVASLTAFTLWGLWADGSVPLPAALIIALALAAGLGALEYAVLLPLAGATTAARTVATLGLLLVAQGAIVAVWGPAERILPLLVHGAVGSGQLRLGYQQLASAIVAVVAAVGLAWWARQRPTGIAALAIGEDIDAARLLGVPARRVAAGAWAVAGAVAGAAGVLLSGLTVLNGSEMTLAMMGGLAAALVAGFDRVSVAMVAAAAVGAVTAAAGSIDAVSSVPGLVESLALVFVIALVIARPSGLLEASGGRT